MLLEEDCTHSIIIQSSDVGGGGWVLSLLLFSKGATIEVGPHCFC